MNANKLIGWVIFISIFTAVLPTIITQVVAAQGTTGIDTGTSALIGLLPLVIGAVVVLAITKQNK